jgi:hypothetical protein
MGVAHGVQKVHPLRARLDVQAVANALFMATDGFDTPVQALGNFSARVAGGEETRDL